MARKTVRFNKSGLEKLPENKPVVYKIITKGGRNNYTGIAKRGRVQERLSEHLPGGPDAIPGAKVVIEQVDNLPTAKRKEANTIKRTQPKYNTQGKKKLQRASAPITGRKEKGPVHFHRCVGKLTICAPIFNF